jgi:hypothetical protein
VLGAGGLSALSVKWLEYRQKAHEMDQTHESGVLERMETRLTIVEAAERECQNAKESLLREIGTLRSENAGLKADVAQIKRHIERANGSRVIRGSCCDDGRITAWFDAADGAWIGWRCAEMLGSPIERLVPPEARDAHIEAFTLAARSAEPIRNRQFRDVYIQTAGGATMQATVIVNTVERDGNRSFEFEIHRRDE